MRGRWLRSSGLVCVLCAYAVAAEAGATVAGAIFTTVNACDGSNINIFSAKDDVYVDGGPAHIGAAGLPDGSYYVRVTEPGGALLGTSVGSGIETPVHVTNGEFDQCYQLSAILIKASDQSAGYDDTTNSLAEYVVWISQAAEFPSESSKSDNFKITATSNGAATVNVVKFYDANANGQDDDGQSIAGWKVRIQDGIDLLRFTPAAVTVDPDTYTITELFPAETNWMPTTATSGDITVPANGTANVAFGNLCLAGGGAKATGFWPNKNGEALIDASDLTMLSGLNLRDATGNDFNPTSYPTFRSWLLSATATNMAYMLSAQLAAMGLNVSNGLTSSSSIIYAPGTLSANALGFATVNAIIAEANASLATQGYSVGASPVRAYQEALKKALDAANNNKTFVQPTSCPFTFVQ